MKFASTAELKNKTNKLIRAVEKGQTVVVTRRGKPVVALRTCSEEDIEDLVLETDPRIRRSIRESEEEFRSGRGISLTEFKKRHL
jgi:prevent-host-death family protein